MDIVLKRRLIGASILIALAVIFVPMLLVDPDSVVDGTGDSVDVPPMPESAGEVRRIPLDPDAARLSDAAASRERPLPPASSEPPPLDDVSSPTTAPVGEEEPVSTQAEAPPPDHEIVLRPELVEAEEGTAADDADDDAGTEADAPASEPTRPAPDAAAAAAKSGPASESGDRVSLGDYIVQVASFGAEASANRVRDQLEALGHIVNRDEIVRGETLLYRLRTGPYPSRSAAERALEQIRTTVTGVDPMVRELGDQAGDGGEPGFVVQVGSFVGEDNAESETARLAELGFDARRFSERVGERTIWRVVVGPVDDRAEADALKQRVADEAGVEGLVVSYP
jgi:DedD protein